MAKVQKISTLQHTLSLYSIEEKYNLFCERFLKSDLCKIWQAIPWQDLVAVLGLKENRLGRPALFSPRGKIALMFLKNYIYH